MEEVQKHVYQFKIALRYIKPKIWRRILVPEDYSFRDLSFAILNAMGWYGDHLHSFTMKSTIPKINWETISKDPSEVYEAFCKTQDTDITDEKNSKIKDFFINSKSKAIYTYDLGASWLHEVELEKILPATPGKKYPCCVAGRRACPVEDVSDERVLEILDEPKDLRTEEDNELLQKYGLGDYDPAKFNKDDIDFDDRKFGF